MAFLNEGTWDRTLRLLVGLGLLYAGWRVWSGPLAIGALAIGAIALVTGVIGCARRTRCSAAPRSAARRERARRRCCGNLNNLANFRPPSRGAPGAR